MLNFMIRIAAGIQSWVDFRPSQKFFVIPRNLLFYSVAGSLYLDL